MEVYFGHLNDQIYVSYKSQYCCCIFNLGFHSGSVIKNLPASVGDVGSVTGSGRFPGGGNGNPLQYYGPEIPWTEELGGLRSMGL